MSTCYYLKNKENKKIKKEFDQIVSNNLENLKNQLLKLNSDYQLSCEEEIKDKLIYIKDILPRDIIDDGEIPICTVTANETVWDDVDLEHFLKFYKEHEGIYDIEDEYERVLTLEEFLKKV